MHSLATWSKLVLPVVYIASPVFYQMQVWRPGVDVIAEDEELSYDPTAYDCLHKFSLEWPCLSFDFVKDDLGGPRSTFPHTVFMVAGTQVIGAAACLDTYVFGQVVVAAVQG